MSLTNDLRFYADTARDNVVELTSRAHSTVADLRTQAEKAVGQAEKAVNLDAVKSAAEPYVAQAVGLTSLVGERAEEVLGALRQDKRVAAVLATTEALAGVVADTLSGVFGSALENLAKPVQSVTGRGKPAPTTAAPTTATTTAPKSTPPAKAAAKKAPAKAAAKKAPATKAAAKKAPARSATR